MFCYISKQQRQGLLPVCILIKIQRPQNSWLGCRGPELLCLSHQMPWQISNRQSPHCCLPSGNLVWGDKTLETAEKCKLEKTKGLVMGQRQLNAAGFLRSDDPGWRGHENTLEEGEEDRGSPCAHTHVRVCMWEHTLTHIAVLRQGAASLTPLCLPPPIWLPADLPQCWGRSRHTVSLISTKL